MAQDMFHFIVYVNGAIIQGENRASFQLDAPLMFRNTRVNTLYELKQVILSHLASDGPREIRRLAYRFQVVTPDDRLEYRPSGFCPYELPAVSAPINIVPPDYNSDEDSDYDDESSGHSTDEDEIVPNTPAAGGPRLVLPAPKPIPALTDVPSFFQQLDIDVRHVEDHPWSLLLSSITRMEVLSSRWAIGCRIERQC
ncbi:hypothetical protein PIB30_015304 [Stylosanthes scabra]|uniref:Uncharacterized protein n=1 Tax=Stylosanthes scabra TaxID=79078 RepID=A0ABU6Z4E9_9FABA|nr:hypothetical protein [Stylosanthes scabra]